MAKTALLTGLMGFTAISAQSGGTVAALDVIIRDFPVTHPDFENFTEEKPKILAQGTTVPGYMTDAFWVAKSATCANEANPGHGIPIGIDAYPMVQNPFLPALLVPKTSASTQIFYGEYDNCNYDAKLNPGSRRRLRGFRHEMSPICGSEIWAQGVFVTHGMVAPYLAFPEVDGAFDFYAPVIARSRQSCDNDYFDQWYQDDQSVNRRSNVVLEIPMVDQANAIYEIDYNWNNGGYFPLDLVNPVNNMRTGETPNTAQFGAQSLSIFCPPYDYLYANDQQNYDAQSTAGLCNAWKASGGPRTPAAAAAAALSDPTLGAKHLRNYNFTMMGYGKFKYKDGSTEIFEFAGDDDMWIFIDGVLAVDLGGTHLAAPGKVEIAYLAQQGFGCLEGPLAVQIDERCEPAPEGTSATGYRWKHGSWHHLHFFYADRQTDGSNMRIRTSLSEIAPTAFGQPSILNAEVIIENGKPVTYLFLNTKLSNDAVNLILASLNNPGYFPILAHRSGTVSGTGRDTLAYNVTGFSYERNAGAQGQVYKLEGILCRQTDCAETTNPALYDSLSFNYPANPEDFTNRFSYLLSTGLYITSEKGTQVTSYYWGPITKMSISTITEITPSDPGTIDRPPVDPNVVIPTKPGGSKPGTSLQPGGGGNLANNATGEIVVTPLPSEYVNDPSIWMSTPGDCGNLDGRRLSQYECWAKSPVGSLIEGGMFGETKGNGSDGGRFNFVQSGTSNATDANGGYTRCYTDAATGDESCAGIAFITTQAFSINIRVFDHLGHFVTQYSESLDGAAIDKINQAQPSQPDNCVDPATMDTYPGVASGYVLANVKMYPVAQNGRKMATGPYIYQVSLIEKPTPHCVNVGGMQTFLPGEYKRTQFSMTRGFRRVKEVK
ncbi:MAG: fibro-slime domain-containing protein [Fibrobacter sp.]|nr:fibro-slime domain-containing protein [Fibrobacter sp.]